MIKKEFERGESSCTSVCLLSDCNIASSYGDGSIKIWNIDNQLCMKTLSSGHKKHVYCIIGLPKLNLASCSEDCTILIWDIKRAEISKKMKHKNVVFQIIFLGNKQIASASGDKTIRIWNYFTGETICKLKGKDEFYTVKLLDKSRIISSGYDKLIRIIDAEEGSQQRKITTDHAKYVWTMDLSRKRRRIVTGSGDGKIKIFNYKKSKCLKTITFDSETSSCIKAIVYIPSDFFDGFLATDESGIIKLYEIKTKKKLVEDSDSEEEESKKKEKKITVKCIREISIHDKNPVTSITLLKDGKICSTANDGSMKIFSLPEIESSESKLLKMEQNQIRERIEHLESNVKDLNFLIKGPKGVIKMYRSLIYCHSENIIFEKDSDELFKLIKEGDEEILQILNLNKKEVGKLKDDNILSLIKKRKSEITVKNIPMDFKILIKILTGVFPFDELEESKILNYFNFFKELQMKKLMYVTLEQLENSSNLKTLIGLLLKSCSRGIELKKKQQQLKIKTSFEYKIFNILRKRKKEIDKDSGLASILEKYGLLEQLQNYSKVKIEKLDDFDEISVHDSYEDLSYDVLSQIYSDSENSNYVLKANDSDKKFFIHKEIVTLRSNFFYKILKFANYRSNFDGINMTLTQLTGEELKALLNYCYKNEFSNNEYHVLFSLLAFSYEHNDTTLKKKLIEKCKKVTKTLIKDGKFKKKFIIFGSFVSQNPKIEKLFTQFWINEGIDDDELIKLFKKVGKKTDKRMMQDKQVELSLTLQVQENILLEILKKVDSLVKRVDSIEKKVTSLEDKNTTTY